MRSPPAGLVQASLRLARDHYVRRDICFASGGSTQGAVFRERAASTARGPFDADGAGRSWEASSMAARVDSRRHPWKQPRGTRRQQPVSVRRLCRPLQVIASR